MEKSRLTITLKLLLLLGLPIVVLLGLFTFGVRLGVHNKETIVAIEAGLFGFEVDKSSDDGGKKPDATDTGTGDGAGDATPDGAPKPTDKPPEPAVDPTPATPPDPKIPPPASPTPEPIAPTPVTPKAPDLPPIASRPIPPDDLVGALASTRVVTVKVLVDSTTLEAHPDWVDYVQRLLSLSSANFVNLFGIELRLYGVMQWEVSPNPLHADDFLELVKEQPRDGADILLAITDREMVDGVGGSAETWDTAGKNGAYAVVYAVPTRREPHLQGTMHELGHLMGAKDIAEAGSPDFRGDNFMSYAPHDQSLPPAIDDENLGRVLRRKTNPFVSDADGKAHAADPTVVIPSHGAGVP